jgi:hypothetical protein
MIHLDYFAITELFAWELALLRGQVASIHRAAEKSSSRKPNGKDKRSNLPHDYSGR